MLAATYIRKADDEVVSNQGFQNPEQKNYGTKKEFDNELFGVVFIGRCLIYVFMRLEADVVELLLFYV